MTAEEIAKGLSAPFPADEVQWRVGATNKDKTKGMAVCFIDARSVMKRFDEVCGPFGWQVEHHVDGSKTTCRIGVLNPDTNLFIWKSDGAGETDVEGAKGGYSDSLKRAAVLWGVARYLYDTPSPWVAIEPRGNSYVITENEYHKLRQMLQRIPGTPVSHVRPTSSHSGEDQSGAGFTTPTTNGGQTKFAPDVSADRKQKLMAAMEKQKTKDQLRAWVKIDKVQATINGLVEADWSSFNASYQSTWSKLPDTILDGG